MRSITGLRSSHPSIHRGSSPLLTTVSALHWPSKPRAIIQANRGVYSTVQSPAHLTSSHQAATKTTTAINFDLRPQQPAEIDSTDDELNEPPHCTCFQVCFPLIRVLLLGLVWYPQDPQLNMPSNSGQILAFKHGCFDQSRIFCFRVPKHCPLCDRQIVANKDRDNDDIVEDPAQELLLNLEEYCSNQISDVKILPSPLKSANQSSCSLAIRPSKGNFLIDYKNSSDLHICVTTSDGKVVEFDQNGVRCHDLTSPNQDSTTTTTTDSKQDNPWKSCLIIKMFDNLTPATSQLWDSKLFEFIQNDRWIQSAYDPINNNCFDFVLQFLRSLDLDYFNTPSISCKTKFCEQFIVPKTKLLARYLSLYRKIEAEKVVILELAR